MKNKIFYYSILLTSFLLVFSQANAQDKSTTADSLYNVIVTSNIDEQIPVNVKMNGTEQQLMNPAIHKNKPFSVTLEPLMLEFFQPLGAGLIFSHWEVDWTPQEKGKSTITIDVTNKGTINIRAAFVYASTQSDRITPGKKSTKGIAVTPKTIDLSKVVPWKEGQIYQLNDLVDIEGGIYRSEKQNNSINPKLGLCNFCGWTALGSAAPKSRFYWSPEIPKPNQEITLDASASKISDLVKTKITDYKWDLGNGKTVTGKTAKVTFDKPGDYKVALFVTDANGNTTRKTQLITVTENDKLVVTPPMGWNFYNYFGNIIERGFDAKTFEDKLKDVVDSMLAHNFLQLGYNYINFDSGWAEDFRDKDGNMVDSKVHFPHGMDYIVDYIHSKGFKAGIYLTDGIDNLTYDHKPGSLGYEAKDAQLISNWGFDYVKYDCRVEDGQKRDIKAEMITMSKALRATGRPIVFSMCEHGRTKPWTWASEYASLWRIGTDIRDGMIVHPMHWSYTFNDCLDNSNIFEASKYQKPGAINDPDFLITGLYGNGSAGLSKNTCTPVEYRAQFSLWSLIGAPLIMGNDPRNLDEVSVETLSNAEIIAVDQDPLVKGGIKLRDDGDVELYAKELAGGQWAVGLYNRSEKPINISLKWSELKIANLDNFTIRDLWAHQDLGTFNTKFVMKVQPHACEVVRLTPVE